MPRCGMSIGAAIALLFSGALDAGRQWIFKPAAVAGQPVAVWVAIPFRFPSP